ncbi:MAG: two-component regulator propeller domain-containing protein [Bacteroidota bacterium]
MRRALACPCLALLLFSCKNPLQEGGNAMPRLYPPPVTVKLNLEEGYRINQVTGDSIYPVITAIGDTVPTGVPVPARGRIVDADRLTPPRIVPVGKMKIIPAHPNAHQIPEKIAAIPISENHPGRKNFNEDTTGWVLVNAYGDTVPTGVPLKLEGKVVPCLQPEPVTALPPGIKENATYEIRYLDMTHGLSSAYTNVLMKDSRGHIWIGTSGAGACRYDGRTFTHFSRKEGLSGIGVQTIFEDSKGNLWFGTAVGGVSKYDGANFTHYTEKEGFMGDDVQMIMEDHQGNLWFVARCGLKSGGLSRYDGDTFTHLSFREGFPGIFVLSVLEDRSGNIWMGSFHGITMYDGRHFKYYGNDFVPSRVLAIFEDSKNSLWFGFADNTLSWFGNFDGGLSYFDGKNFTHHTVREGLSHNQVNSILEDGEGFLWCGTGSGVSRYNRDAFTHVTPDDGLSNGDVLHMMDDGEGNFWMATKSGGVNMLKQKSFRYLTKESGLTDNHISSVLEDRKGNLWFASSSGGVSIYDGENFRHLTMNEGLSSDVILAMCEDHEGNIWMGTLNNGITVYQGEVCKQFLDPEGVGKVDIYDIMEDSKGKIWIGHYTGLASYDGNSYVDYTIREGLTCDDVRTILEDRYGNIWFGTWGGGISKFDGQTFTHYTEREGLSGRYITDLAEDKHGNLWVGTWGAGVNRFDGETFTCITQREGLNGDYISSILEDSLGNIWVSTTKGLNQLVYTGGSDHPVIYTYNNHDIKTSEFTSGDWALVGDVSYDSRNRIWWANPGGLTMLDMNEFSTPAKPPQNLQFSHLEINGQFIDYRNLPDSMASLVQFDDVPSFCNYPVHLKIPHRLNHLTFHLSSTDWAAPHKIMYSYRMEGLDRQWSFPASESRVDYRNIPHGTYTFRFCAIGAAQKWSEPFEYTFTIRPPWWFSWWAYMVYGLLLLSLIMLYRRYLLKRAALRSAVDIERIEKEKVLEMDQMKSRFFANISHEFRTPLTLILGPIEGLLKKKDKEVVVKRDELGILHRNAKRLQQLINQILDIARLETGKVRLEVSEGNLTGFVKRIVLSFLSLAESKHIQYTFDLPDIPGRVWFDRDKLEKIVTNLISNAFKFTPPGGEINIGLKYILAQGDDTSELVKISVKDTGRGIPADKIDKIFDRFYQAGASDTREYEGTGIGLALAKELVDIYRGEIRVESQPGKGSLFTVRLPVAGEHFKLNEMVESETDEMAQPIADESPEDAEAVGTAQPVKNHADCPVILIVEDNADLRHYISSNLKDKYRILEAGNGREGLAIAIEEIPDLMISDLMMPEMDGIELCRQIRDDRRTSHIPLVLLTAKADRGSKMEGLETGADDYIIKPFDAEELLVRVRNLIGQRKRLREKFRQEILSDDADLKTFSGDELLEKIMEILEQHLTDAEFSIDQLADRLHMSRSQVFRKIGALTDYTPGDLIRHLRLRKAAGLFRSGHKHIAQVMHRVGFNSQSYFTKCFSEHYGLTPTEYIRRKVRKAD